jgi:hypothetical protein
MACLQAYSLLTQLCFCHPDSSLHHIFQIIQSLKILQQNKTQNKNMDVVISVTEGHCKNIIKNKTPEKNALSLYYHGYLQNITNSLQYYYQW